MRKTTALLGIMTIAMVTAVSLPAQTMADAPPAQTFTTLHNFDGTDGDLPYAGLIQASNGNLYGTTYYGGANGDTCPVQGDLGCGTVFKITPSGTLTTSYSFCPQSGCADGEGPYAGLVQDTGGVFYGANVLGGANYEGTVFKITLSGVLTTLYNFCSQRHCADGQYPVAALVQATDGDFYGTTNGGGSGGACGQSGCGTIFKLTPSGTLTTLHRFDGTDGAYPVAALIQGTGGDFYGTTYAGGANGGGTVFKITPRGMLTTLYTFCSQSNCTDGKNPEAGLVQSTDGNFYGATMYGGSINSNTGTVFKITPSGALTTLHSFDGTDGAYPESGLIQATDGKFYGTTFQGGAIGEGTIYRITPSGTLTTLYSFCFSQNICTDGFDTMAGLVQATNGKFYGTTQFGGTGTCTYSVGCGTVFSLSVGLGPFVETQPTSGAVGKAIKILGTNLTGATSVIFNGSAAAYTVVSKSLITTTVPTGATTGAVQVITPGGTLSSNVPFTVR